MTILPGQLELTEVFFWLLRVLAGIGGAFVGWFISDPLTRLLYRLFANRPTPRWLLPWTKAIGAGIVGFLVFLLIPLGGGPGGLGFGPGPGGQVGLGNGVAPNGVPDPTPNDKPTNDKVRDDQKEKEKLPRVAVREPVQIELIGGERYQGDGRFYLLHRKEPARSLDEVEHFFKERHEKLEVHIVLTEQSVGRRQGALARLLALTKQYQIPTVEPPEQDLAKP